MVEGTRKGTSRARNAQNRYGGTHGDRCGCDPLANQIAIDVLVGQRE